MWREHGLSVHTWGTRWLRLLRDPKYIEHVYCPSSLQEQDVVDHLHDDPSRHASPQVSDEALRRLRI